MTSTQEARSDGLRRVGVRCLIIQCRTEHCLLFSRAVNKTAGIPYSKGKESKIAALVGNELVTKAKEACDIVIHKDEFYDYGTNPKKTKTIVTQG